MSENKHTKKLADIKPICIKTVVVAQAFDDYRRGDVIKDPAKVDHILKTRAHCMHIINAKGDE